MSKTRTTPRKPKHGKAAIDAPADPAILTRAKKIAAKYQIIMHEQDGEFYGRGLELPWTMDDGKTPAECYAKTRDALVASVAYMLEQGQVPPKPAAAAAKQTRKVQVNVRMTEEERRFIESAARSKGYEGISDYIRERAIRDAR